MVGIELELTCIHDGISMSLYGVETEQFMLARVGKYLLEVLETFCTHEMWEVVRLSCAGSIPLACNQGIASFPHMEKASLWTGPRALCRSRHREGQ